MERLQELRSRLDELDKELVRVVAERLAVCRDVAEVKAATNSTVIQPARVAQVITSRRELAAASGVDPEFAEALFRVILAETHRIEAADNRRHEAAAPIDKPAPDTALQITAARIDHVVLAVANLPLALDHLVNQLGFRLREAAVDIAASDIAVLDAGGVELVLVEGADDTGVYHVGIEVLDGDYVRTALEEKGVRLATPMVMGADGRQEFLTARDDALGVRFAVVSRTGDRSGSDAQGVRALLDAVTEPDS
jgi:chorismate mutase-like protein